MSIERALVLPTHKEAFTSALPNSFVSENSTLSINNQLKKEIKASTVTGWALRGIGAGLVIYGLYQLTQEHYATAAICLIGGYIIFQKGSQLLNKNKSKP